MRTTDDRWTDDIKTITVVNTWQRRIEYLKDTYRYGVLDE